MVAAGVAAAFEGGEGHIGELDLAFGRRRGLEGGDADRAAVQMHQVGAPGIGARIAGEQGAGLGEDLARRALVAAEAWRQRGGESLRIGVVGERDQLERHAAFLRCRRPSSSAIWTAFSAAPLRRLSETHQSERPLSTVGSSRTRLT